jgi:ribosome production factor 1
MSGRKFEPSQVKNKIKREDEHRKAKRSKRRDKLDRRLARAKEEADDPAAKQVRAPDRMRYSHWMLTL